MFFLAGASAQDKEVITDAASNAQVFLILIVEIIKGAHATKKSKESLILVYRRSINDAFCFGNREHLFLALARLDLGDLLFGQAFQQFCFNSHISFLLFS